MGGRRKHWARVGVFSAIVGKVCMTGEGWRAVNSSTFLDPRQVVSGEGKGGPSMWCHTMV